MLTEKLDGSPINQNKIIDQIRCLGIDMIDEANSGHPGIVLGAAPIIYTLYAHHLKFDPKNPNYFKRDRFVMSAGHGSALLSLQAGSLCYCPLLQRSETYGCLRYSH